MTAITKSKPCNCGGGGGGDCGCGGHGGSGGGCGCGGKCGDECQGGPLQRPLFFAGQLLTEDDLQLLSDYAATKGRMHNRFLHGSGVVCGLLVGCHPCGGGKVTVHSGAALDCCGNDIYVPCSVELDINPMVNDLRLKLRGGHDCGDPCEADCDDSPDDIRCLDRKGRKYCLYVKYCEELEEPVTPYVSNGDCAVQVCKPTRIHEGYTFELRCPTDQPEPDNIFSRIRCCIGDLTSADKSASDVLAADAYGRRYHAVAAKVRAGQVDRFADADHEQIKSGLSVLSPDTSIGRVAIDGGAVSSRQMTETRVRNLLDHYQATAAAVIRYDLQTEQAKEELRKTNPGLDKDVENARSAVHSRGNELKAQSAELLDSARDRLVADLWVTQGIQWTDAKATGAMKMSEQQLLYAYNAPTSIAQSRQFGRDLNQLRDWLLGRIEHKAMFSDCRLRRDVYAIQIPTSEGKDDPKLVADASRKLVEALLRYLIDCICASLNPPCQPCCDDAVLLACVTVEDCEVVRICNLERTFVLSGPAMRYWLPFLHTIGEFFEKACCKFEVRLPQRDPNQIHDVQEQEFIRSQNYMATTAPAYRHVEERPQLAALMQVANVNQAELKAAVNLVGDVGGLAMAGRDFAGAGLELDIPGFGKRAKASLIDAVAREPDLGEALVRPVANELAGVRDRIAALNMAGEKMAVELQDAGKALEKRLADSEELNSKAAKELRTTISDQGKQVTALTKSLEKRIAADETSTRTIRELQTALREQIKRNDTLERRLIKLESGGPS